MVNCQYPVNCQYQRKVICYGVLYSMSRSLHSVMDRIFNRGVSCVGWRARSFLFNFIWRGGRYFPQRALRLDWRIGNPASRVVKNASRSARTLCDADAGIQPIIVQCPTAVSPAVLAGKTDILQSFCILLLTQNTELFLYMGPKKESLFD